MVIGNRYLESRDDPKVRPMSDNKSPDLFRNINQ